MIKTNLTSEDLQKAVVIGGNGFIGGAVSNQLRTDGLEVVSIGRDYVDLLDNDAPKKLKKIIDPGDTVIVTSAIAPCKNLSMLADNMRLVDNVLSAIERSEPAHVLNISSDAVYPDSSGFINEEMLPSPTSIHGAMHHAREIAFNDRVNVPLVHVRPTLVYGPGDPHNGYGPNKFVRVAVSGENIKLFGAGEELRDHIFINDVAKLISLIVIEKIEGSLNLVSGQVTSFDDLANKIVEMVGSKSVIEHSKRIGPMPHNGYRAFDNSKIHKVFDTFEFTSLSDGLLHSVQAF